MFYESIFSLKSSNPLLTKADQRLVKTKWFHLFSFMFFGSISLLWLLSVFIVPTFLEAKGVTLTERSPDYASMSALITCYLFFAYSKAKLDHMKSIGHYLNCESAATSK